jgi:hypothetical protein
VVGKDVTQRAIATLSEALAELPEFPKRIDQMTPSEYAIAIMTCQLVGAIQTTLRILQGDQNG